jgi:Membrane bound beta barrel domain (DUF5777)
MPGSRMESRKNDTELFMKQIILLPALLLVLGISHAQTILGTDTSTGRVYSKRRYADSSFAGTRLVNFHTIQMNKKGTVKLHIAHRFGELKSGQENLWGIDGPANIRIGFDYSLLDNLTLGIGRSANKKIVDGFAKYRFVRQAMHGSPVSMAFVGSMNVQTDKDPNKGTADAKYPYTSSRFSYLAQLILARKFTKRFSFQAAPTFIHYNLVEKLSDKNDMFFVPVAARFNLTHWLSITGEYGIKTFKYQRDMSGLHDSFSLGFDMGTGGHVFQIFCTNSYGINEVQALPYTTGNWQKGQVRIGFNVSRVF